MNFIYDVGKDKINIAKHGIDFGTAAMVFFDPFRIETYDTRENYGEDRWATIGMANSRVLYVVYTVRDGDVIRLISARKANETERRKYRQANP